LTTGGFGSIKKLDKSLRIRITPNQDYDMYITANNDMTYNIVCSCGTF
jgi:hypothetical protein